MNSRNSPRPGGRSARVQAAVHLAAKYLITQVGRDELTVPMIAARAGVTPSTIYRRWGDLADLLADVAVDRLRAETEPTDTGTVLGDLQAWSEQFFDEMTSEVGLSMMRDVLSGSIRSDFTCQCAVHIAGQIQVIVERARLRDQSAPDVDAVMDGVVAPIIYRTLFGPTPATRAHVRAFVDHCVDRATRR